MTRRSGIIAAAAAKLAWDAGHRNIAIVNLNNDWGNNLARQFSATFRAMGGKVAAQVTYNAEQPSYRGEVNRALDARPDSAFVISTVIDGSKILRDWISLGASGAMRHDQYGGVTTPFVGWQVENKTYVQKKNVSAEEVAELKQKTGT